MSQRICHVGSKHIELKLQVCITQIRLFTRMSSKHTTAAAYPAPLVNVCLHDTLPFSRGKAPGFRALQRKNKYYYLRVDWQQDTWRISIGSNGTWVKSGATSDFMLCISKKIVQLSRSRKGASLKEMQMITRCAALHQCILGLMLMPRRWSPIILNSETLIQFWDKLGSHPSKVNQNDTFSAQSNGESTPRARRGSTKAMVMLPVELFPSIVCNLYISRHEISFSNLRWVQVSGLQVMEKYPSSHRPDTLSAPKR